jgi:hypothetical protein
MLGSPPLPLVFGIKLFLALIM